MRTTDTHGAGQFFQRGLRGVPADARVGDALSVREHCWIAKILPTFDQKAFDHRADDAALAGDDLLGEIVHDDWLLAEIAAAVAVAGIHYQTRG